MKAWHGVFVSRHTKSRKTLCGCCTKSLPDEARAKKSKDVPPSLALTKFKNERVSALELLLERVICELLLWKDRILAYLTINNHCELIK